MEACTGCDNDTGDGKCHFSEPCDGADEHGNILPGPKDGNATTGGAWQGLRAYAALLEAAPKLLAVCEDVLNRLDLESAVDAMNHRDCDHPRAAIRDLLRAAIAKAQATA